MLTRLSLSVVLTALAMTACGPAGPATLEFVDITPAQPRIGEITTIKFKATDYRGEAQAGTTVKFRLLADKPGVELTPASGTTLKGTGEVTVQLIATARVTSVTIVADGGGDKLAYSPPISFAGSTPSGRQLTFQCGPFGGPASGGVHAIHVFDESRNFIAGSRVNCTAHLGDRNGDGVPGGLVSFMAEAGTIGPTATSTADVLGNATILYKSSFPMPRETEPLAFSWNPAKSLTQTGEYLAPLWMHPYEWQANPIVSYGQPPTLQEPRRKDPLRKSVPQPTNNPRDNLVTMIAVTAGEEGFTDVNNNGTYDTGEPIDDLTEPFVDSNDDGTWDAEEKFVDVNGNGVWDGRNGIWDSNTLIWVSERITWTGTPSNQDYLDTVAPVFRGLGFVPDQACTGASTPVHPCIDILEYVQADFIMSDPWFNGIAQNGDSDGCELISPDDKPLVVASPRKAAGGRLFTYPSVTGFTVTIKDARDPNAMPQVPIRNPPLKWVTPLKCTYTSSPEQGFQTVLQLDTLVGYVQ